MEKRLAMKRHVLEMRNQVKLGLPWERPDFVEKIFRKSLARLMQTALIRTESRDSSALTINKTTNKNSMAKALSKSQIAAAVAEKNGITKKQATEILESITDLAYKNAKNSFTLPGLGKLVLVNRKARIGRNPATGEQIQIPAKKVVKFRVAKAAKDAILK
jgi:DNA-binding protein HU-beta